MAKAKEITGLHPRLGVRTALPAIFGTRIAELWSWAEHMPFPERVRELHNMRIAAKRLRYCFEFFHPCFDARLEGTLKRFKKLQDFLGELHDCDVWVDYLRTQLKDAFADCDVHRKALGQFIGADLLLKAEADTLREELARGPVQGLLMMLGDVVERRARLYGELLVFWDELERDDFRGQLSRAVGAAARGEVGR